MRRFIEFFGTLTATIAIAIGIYQATGDPILALLSWAAVGLFVIVIA